MNRRSAFAAVPILALAGCATTSGNASVGAVVNEIQFLLPMVDALALGISVAVPGTATIMNGVIDIIDKAAPIFQTLDPTMTAVQAQPIVQQMEGYISAAVNAIAGVVASTPSLNAYQTRVQQAEAVVGLLITFVNGVTAGVTAKAMMAPLVATPLLHR